MLSVLNVKQELVQGLELCVRPQPYVLDQTFRFHQVGPISSTPNRTPNRNA
jgi:hypothetical protein